MTFKGRLQSEAYSRLEALIVCGDLPPGSFHTERALSDALAIGRTPIRDALIRLSHDALVRVHPRRGIEIAPICSYRQLRHLKLYRHLDGLVHELALDALRQPAMRKMAAGWGHLADPAPTFRDVQDCHDYLSASQALLEHLLNFPELSVHYRAIANLCQQYWLHFAAPSDWHKLGALLSARLRHLLAGDRQKLQQAHEAYFDYLKAFTDIRANIY